MKLETYQSLLFVPNLGILDSRVRQISERDNSTNHLTERYIEQLSYFLSSAAYSLIRLCESQMKVFKFYEKGEYKKDEYSIRQLNNFEWHEMSFELDGFLYSAHRAQNAIWLYLSKIFSISASLSLSKIIKKIEKGFLNIPEKVNQTILSYWNQTGKILKDYRDLSQHFAVVASDGRITRLPNGILYLYLVLPNNPSEKNVSSLNYENPRIDALPYAIDTYIILYRFICELIFLLLSYTEEKETELFSFSFKGSVRNSFPPQGFQRIDTSDILKKIDAIKKEFNNG